MSQTAESTLRKASVFQGLTDAELKTLAAMGEHVRFLPRETVVEESATGGEFFVILSGRVSIHVTMPDGGDSEPIAMLQVGETFGESVILGRTRRIASAIAKDEVEVCRWNVERLLKHFESDPRTGYVMMTNIARVIHDRLTSTNMLLRNTMNRVINIF